jgi:hypothetical protein
MLLYRAGRLEEAARCLAEGYYPPGGGDAIGWLFRAMTHARLGHTVEARQWLAKATAWLDRDGAPKLGGGNPQGWKPDLLLHSLRREAEALIPLAAPR